MTTGRNSRFSHKGCYTDEASMKWANSLLEQIGKRGGDAQAARDSNPYIWPRAGAGKAVQS